MQDPIFTPIFTSLLASVGITGGITIAGTTITYGALLSGVATAALTALVGVLLAPSPPKPEDGRAPITQAVPARIFGYGTARIGGAVMLWEEWNKHLFLVAAVAGHRVHQIRGFWADEERVTVGEYGFVQETGSERFGNDTVYIDTRVGLPTETAYDHAVTRLSSTGMYDADSRGDGQASFYAFMQGVKSKDFGKRYGGIPRWSAEVDLALCWDFRDPYQDPEDETTWEWTRNPVIHIAHYLCFSEFGFRRDYTEAILPVLDMWVEEANICDEPIARKGGGTEPRYQCDGWFTTENEPKAVLNALLSACDGWVCERGDGAYLIRVGKYREPTVILTDEDLCGWFLQSDVPAEDACNKLVPRITYAAAEYAPTECDAFEDVADQLSRGRVLERMADLVTTLEWRQGRRLAKREWVRLQEKVKGALDVRLSGINGVYERWIRIQSTKIPRLNDVVVENRNARVALTSGGFRIEFVKTSENIDDWDELTEEGLEPPIPERPDDAIQYVPANVNAVAEEVSVGSGGATGVYLNVSWDDPDEDTLDYIIEYRVKVTSGTPLTWTREVTDAPDVNAGRLSFQTRTVPVNETLEVRVASLYGNRPSSWSTTVEVSTAIDITAPGTPSIGTITVDQGVATIPITAPNSASVHHMRLWRVAAGGGFGTAVDVSGEIYCVANQTINYEDIPSGSASYDYFVTAENAADVSSSPAGPSNATAGFASESLTAIAAMTVPPSTARKKLINNFISALKTAGVWTKLDLVYLMAAHDAQAARLNLKTPASFAMSVVGAPVFTTDRGYKGDGVDDYLEPGFNPATAGGNFSLNSAYMGVWIETAHTTAGTAMSEIGNAQARLWTKFNSTNIATRLNDGTSTTGAGGGATGYYDISRTGSGSYERYHNTTTLTTASVASTSVTSANIQVLRASTTTHSDARVSAAFVGGGLTSVEREALRSALRTYLTAVGVA
jgi:hypothetical protein